MPQWLSGYMTLAISERNEMATKPLLCPRQIKRLHNMLPSWGEGKRLHNTCRIREKTTKSITLAASGKSEMAS